MIDGLKLDQFFRYYNAMGPILSQEKLREMEVSGYPHVKDQARKELFTKYSKEAKKMNPPKVMTSEELGNFLKGKI